jgi:hypothetical protein
MITSHEKTGSLLHKKMPGMPMTGNQSLPNSRTLAVSITADAYPPSHCRPGTSTLPRPFPRYRRYTRAILALRMSSSGPGSHCYRHSSRHAVTRSGSSSLGTGCNGLGTTPSEGPACKFSVGQERNVPTHRLPVRCYCGGCPKPGAWPRHFISCPAEAAPFGVNRRCSGLIRGASASISHPVFSVHPSANPDSDDGPLRQGRKPADCRRAG